MLQEILDWSYSNFGLIALAAVLATLLFNRYGYRINHIPGPSWASWTDLWRLWVVWGRRPELTHIDLHQRYGPVVRLGPKTVSVADPDAIKIIYALNAGFIKSRFYPVQMTVAKGRALHSMFNTDDEVFHAKLRRAVSNAYAMSTLVNFEPLVDSTIVVLIEQLKKRYAQASKVCDFGQMLQFFAFDVIGELTYSKRLGFVERDEDVDSIIGNLEWLLNYVAVIGQIPVLDKVLLKNPIRLWLSKHGYINSTSPVVTFARERIAERTKSTPSDDEQDSKTSRRDFLARFSEAHKKDPAFITNERVLALTVANMFAGSDTTAITMRAIFYHLLKNPHAMQKLLAEFAEQERYGAFPKESHLVSWNHVKDLPYLSAVIKEALRCHPAAGLTLERIVPPQGINVAGVFIPGGTIVGCSAWVIHRDENIFGQDAARFRPERWLDSPKKTEMNNSLFSFGAGARTCIGKNISLLEMYKLVPALLGTFEIELAEPEKEWTLHNAWFVKQSNFKVLLKTRSQPLADTYLPGAGTAATNDSTNL